MPTSLGGGANAGIRLMVKNGEGATIKKGTIVSWSSVAANNPAVGFLDLANGYKDYVAGGGTAPASDQLIPYITVKDSPADTAVPGATAALGVASSDILTGQFGEIITYGICEVLCNAIIAAGITISFDIDGEAVDAAAATEDNPCGITLEATTADNIHWCFVNFIGAATGCSAAGFMGQAY